MSTKYSNTIKIMKIGIATSGDFISNFLINEIRLAFPNDEIVILIDENVGKVDSDFLEQTIFIDHKLTQDFIYPLIENLSIKSSKYLTYNQLSKEKNIQLYSFTNINTQEDLLKKTNPDLIISIKFRTIFKENIINIPKYGIFNVHSGILPEYRGVCCLLRAINNEEEEFGCTLHKIIDSTIDTGDIISTSKAKINKNISYEGNYIKMFSLIFPKVINFIKQI